MKLDAYEEDILTSVENDEWVKSPNVPKRTAELQQVVKSMKKKPLSIRVAENDLYELKKRALESGIPYQVLVQMLIHQYTENRIQLVV